MELQQAQTQQISAVIGANNLQFLSFVVGQEEFAVDIMQVREIKGWTGVTRLPNTPDYMLGVMNLRGLIVPIFDLRCRFHKGLTENDSKKVVIVICINERIIGILVDAVSDIIEVAENDIRQTPPTDSEIDEKYVKGIISLDTRMVIILEATRLFNNSDLKINSTETTNF